EVGETSASSEESTYGDLVDVNSQYEVPAHVSGNEDEHVDEATCSSQESGREADNCGPEMSLQDRKRLAQR
ncbi:unnamed protein product, partial [Allacma fusca]